MMKIEIKIQQEGSAPYLFHIDKEGNNRDFPYQVFHQIFLRKQGEPRGIVEFEDPKVIGEWIGEWIEDYIKKTEEIENDI